MRCALITIEKSDFEINSIYVLEDFRFVYKPQFRVIFQDNSSFMLLTKCI